MNRPVVVLQTLLPARRVGLLASSCLLPALVAAGLFLRTAGPAEAACTTLANGVVCVNVGGNGGGGSDGGVGIGASSGGGGGAADAIALSIAPPPGSPSQGVILIGAGGSGGNGGDMYGAGNAKNGGDGAAGGSITTSITGGQIVLNGPATLDGRPQVAGVYADSVGGNGGRGGRAFGLAGVTGSPGSGGAAGSGGTVELSVRSVITTSGVNVVGIAASSRGGIAGAGGAGGFVFGGSGGPGGAGGTGGAVVLRSLSEVRTSGAGAIGILGQSVGGQGGAGGNGSGLFYGGGGDGVYGGPGGSVTLANQRGAAVFTAGEVAHGVYGLSLGGGGGAGGDGEGIFALGAGGSGGGAGGAVSVANHGFIQTLGLGAVGLYGQSVGGGGGDGGSGAGVGAIGGKGSGTSGGGTVSVTNSFRIITRGEFAQGIFAQSVGGGGGRGGNASGLFSAGGSGGGGGDGAGVTVQSHGQVETSGVGATGIFAQSVGGGGGAGGGALAVGVGVQLAFGGSGAQGGDAGFVRMNAVAINPTENLTGTSVITRGDAAIGVHLQSIGGGGGSGGFALTAGAGPLNFGLAMGGTAGPGGDGGTVLSRYRGTITTLGAGSTGMLLQSVGGGGGNGGAAISLSSGKAAAVAVGLGGSGAIGGRANAVVFDGAADIYTQQAGAVALMAQSVGGGGGNGGLAVAAAAGGTFSGTVAMGGTGGPGGAGGDVTVTNRAPIETAGGLSHGIVAQSIGGGGGNGGLAIAGSFSLTGAVALSFGGNAGAGASAGNVTVNHLAATPASPAPGINYGILTSGDGAHGIVAQSIGGGGGTGGMSGAFAGAGAAAMGVSLGGSGGSGATGGNVTVRLDGDIDTFGQRAFGLLAQSVGGGGGDGGFSLGISAANYGAASVLLGGSAGIGGAASSVTVSGNGRVQTRGDGAVAIMAQSVGGGGGTGGFAVGGAVVNTGAAIVVGLGGTGGTGGHGGIVTVDRAGTIITGTYDTATGLRDGERAHGIVAQSVGGGGGSGGFTGTLSGAVTGVGVSASLGGSGGVGGEGKAVTLTQRGGSVLVWGDGAMGLFAQSVGGGGGDGGFALGMAGAGKGGAVQLTIGGGGAGGGRAGAVTLTALGNVTTAGDLGIAVLGQSIGGGGGNGGFAGGLGYAGKGGAFAANIGGLGGGGGVGGAVSVTTAGRIATFGDLAHGVMAQSVGGGGGNGGIAVGAGISGTSVAMQAQIGGRGGAAGLGGTVLLQQAGAVSTFGEGSHAVFAQSIGGGGGDGGMAIGLSSTGAAGGAGLGLSMGGGGTAGGAGGAVTVVSSNMLMTEGANSYGLYAQSIGGGGGNGGMAITAAIGFGPTASVSLGGSGGGGGAGGDVTVTRRYSASAPVPGTNPVRPLSAYGLPGGNAATIVTQGGNSHGVVAQSIGGGGGNGGLAGSLTVGRGNQSAGVAVAVGGSGGAGGAGGRVTLTVVDRISTGVAPPASSGLAVDLEAESAGLDLLRAAGLSGEGGHARGVIAQSIGGGGGGGGGAVAITLSQATGKRSALMSLGGSVALAGNGGGGGNGGVVNATVVGAVQTAGVHSDGMLVQSIGGGGGTGGFAVAGSLMAGEGTKLTVALGGSGGAGGDAGAARGTFQGDIATVGDSARGVVVQSIGGGGGIGGLSFAGAGNASATGGGKMATVSIGGSGGSGGDGGLAELRVIGPTGAGGSISTQGLDAHALVAQSIGGGGGMGGLAMAAYLGRQGTEEAYNATVSVGGSGGDGGLGGRVVVANAARLSTAGNNAMGILAQSVGGGGGIGGGAISAVLRLGVPEKRQVAVTVAIGGQGGDGNRAGVVEVTNGGLIRTLGDGSHGIFAQSIGGGGGAGGASNAISMAVGQKPTVAPGATSPDMLNWQFTVGVGGFGGTGGHAGAVTVTNRAAISTAGLAAHGMLVQSIGGGGGSGGDGRAGLTGLVPPNMSRSLDLYLLANGLDRANFKRNFKVAVGGSGGASGNGGSVLASNAGAITTTNDWAQAIFAQSIGGGGGTGGLGLAGALGKLSIGGEGTGGGSGGNVSVMNLAGADLSTAGSHASALVAQSIGGGGGAGGGGGGLIVIGRSGGGGGDGGTVNVNNAAGIVTRGGFSAGILAQSVGGGGGLGGASGLGDEPEPGFRVIAIGADSGGNGHGGTARVVNSGTIVTQGAGSWGIVAQSVGGGGGVALFTVPPIAQLEPPPAEPPARPADIDDGAISAWRQRVADLAAAGGQTIPEPPPEIAAMLARLDSWREQVQAWVVATREFLRAPQDEILRIAKRPVISFGADGASGGNGGLAEVTHSGLIRTSGVGAHGILAQSIGGGGGAGTGTGVFDFGSSGGASGNGGEVRVTLNAGAILTTGAGAFGVLAQSIGGGGGAGYADIKFNGSLGFDPNVLTVRTGATTGASGNGGMVTVRLNQDAVVETRGANAFGLVAQSIGGGGGASLGEASGSGNAVLGGDGALGTGGNALVDLAHVSAEVLTRGAGSGGVLVQSIAGGGGILALTPGMMSLGATGTTTGAAGTAEARNAGLVRTLGADSTGIMVQSIAGGGGLGLGTLGMIDLGGGGITTGAGGAAILRNTGTVRTLGERSPALVAQSIGGGGGVAFGNGLAGIGASVLGNLVDSGGAGGNVTLAGGTASAAGLLAPAIIAQSVASGGGFLVQNGGDVLLGLGATLGPQGGRVVTESNKNSSTAASAGSVTIESLGVITSAQGFGVLAQSVAGGGGVVLQAGGTAQLGGASAGVAGTRRVTSDDDSPSVFIAGVGGAGGVVSVTALAADITARQAGLVAQSIGGGGGLVAQAAGAATLGQGAGLGGSVTINLGGDVSTTGVGAPAILAQSIGGGGGAVLSVVPAATLGGGTGAGGAVTLTNAARIDTSGSSSHGIVAQSIGGGGGFVAGSAAPVSAQAGTGAGGEVRVTNSGAINITGNGAHGIVAQSIGGGGGLVRGTAALGGGTGPGGAIFVTNSARIFALGSDAMGIWAESAGSLAGPVTLDLQAGSDVRAATAVSMAGGVLRLGNAGRIDAGIAGTALRARGTDIAVENRGIITGNIDAGPSAASFNNRVGGLFNMGSTVNLSGGTLTNAGGIAVGGRGNIGITTITGNYVQAAGGVNFVDVQGQPTGIVADRLHVEGTARLTGQVRAEMIAGSTLSPGTHRATILSATGGTTLTGPLNLVSPNTLNTTWGLQYPNTHEVVLGVTLTTTAPAARMSANQTAVATTLGRAAGANPTGFASYSSSVYGATNATSYAASMSSLGGDGGVGSLLAAQSASFQFMNGITQRLDMMQRAADQGVPAAASLAPFDLAASFGEGNGSMSGEPMLGMNSAADTMASPFRIWAMPLGASGRLDTSAALGANAESDVGGFMMGFDHQVAPNLVIGSVGGYSNGTYGAANLLARGELEGGHVGAYAMWRSGGLYLSGVLGYGRHESKQSRIIGLEDQSEYARSNAGVQNAHAMLEFGSRFELDSPFGGRFNLTPFAGVGLNGWRQDGSTEMSRAATGADGVLGLSQQARSDYSVPLSVGVRYDQTFAMEGGLTMTPYLRAAWVHESRDSLTSTAAFALSPDQSFNLVMPRTARDRMQLNLGMQLSPNDRLGFGFGVIGDLGDGTQSIGGFGRVVVRW